MAVARGVRVVQRSYEEKASDGDDGAHGCIQIDTAKQLKVSRFLHAHTSVWEGYEERCTWPLPTASQLNTIKTLLSLQRIFTDIDLWDRR
jgi:hypothetical protein